MKFITLTSVVKSGELVVSMYMYVDPEGAGSSPDLD